MVGLDKYAFNQVEASLSGPIFFKKDSVGNKVKPLLGFFLSGQLTDVSDNGPLLRRRSRVKNEVRDAPAAEPAEPPADRWRTSPPCTIPTCCARKTWSDLDTRQNAGSRSLPGFSEVRYRHHAHHQPDRGRIARLQTQTNRTIRSEQLPVERREQPQIRISATAVSCASPSASPRVKRTTPRRRTAPRRRRASRTHTTVYSWTIRAANQNVEDPTHKDNLFDYGYIGRYQTFRAPPTHWRVGRFEQTGFRDTLVTFSPGDANPTIATMTDQFFNLFPDETFSIPLLYGAGGGFNMWASTRTSTRSRHVTAC